MGIKLEARVRALTYNLEGKTVTVYTRILPVDDNGSEIDNPVLKPFDKELVADNKTIVNKSDGSYVDTNAEGFCFDELTMQGEFDYFQSMASTHPVIVNDMILQKLQQAKTCGKFQI